MDNTKENALRFKAQYFGVEVVEWKVITKEGPKHIYTRLGAEQLLEMENSASGGSPISLRDVKDLTDEEAFYVANEIYSDFYLANNSKKDLIDEGRDHIMVSSYTFFSKSHRTDYFRTKGYALPWDGASIKEQLDWNWIALRK